MWRIQAHCENRNDRAHADLGRRIDGLGTRVETLGDGLGTRVEGLSAQVVKVAADVAYLRGRGSMMDGMSGIAIRVGVLRETSVRGARESSTAGLRMAPLYPHAIF